MIILLLPLLPFLWTTETSFSGDLLLLVFLGAALLSLSNLMPPIAARLALAVAYAFIFFAGAHRGDGSGAALGEVIALLAGCGVAALALFNPAVRAQLFRDRSRAFAGAAGLLAAVVIGILIARSTTGAHSGPGDAILATSLALLLFWLIGLAHETASAPDRRALALGIIVLSVVGLVRGGIQATTLQSEVARGDDYLTNGQYQQALEAYGPALELARRKSFRPAERHLRVQLSRTLVALDKPVPALAESDRAIVLNPARAREVIDQVDDPFVTALSQTFLTREANARLAVDLEVSRDGADVYVLDRFGRVFLERPGESKRVFDAGLSSTRRWTFAVDLELSLNGAGFAVIDSFGRIHLGGQPSAALNAAAGIEHPKNIRAVDLELSADESVVYILDSFGTVHAFGPTPFDEKALAQLAWPDGRARGLEIAANGSLIILDAMGATHWIGEKNTLASLPTTPPYWLGQDIARDLVLWPDQQSWAILDANGAVHPVGTPEYDLEEVKPYYQPTFESAVDMEVVPDTGGLVFVDGNMKIYRARPAPKSVSRAGTRASATDATPRG